MKEISGETFAKWCCAPFASEDNVEGKNVSLSQLHHSDVGRVKRAGKQTKGQSRGKAILLIMTQVSILKIKVALPFLLT